MQSRAFSGLPVIGVLTLVYFIAGKFGLMLASLHASASPVWPPAGIALAALLLVGYRAWPAIFVGAFLVNVTTAGNVATSLAVASGNTLEAVCGAWLVNRFAGGATAFDHPEGVFKFALAAVVSTIISPAFGVTSLALAGFADWTNYGAIWLTWWLGDTTGDLLIAPLIILWSIASKRRWNRSEAIEVSILLLLLFVLSEAVFCGWLTISAGNYPIAFICGSLVIWTAFRFTQRETATGIFILSAIAIWGTMHGFGPFAGETENQSLLALQSWTAVLAITAMALSAGMAERDRAEAEALQRRQEVGHLSRMAVMGEMAASIAHELNQPLSGIISNASAGKRFIDRGNVDLGELRDLLADIVADGHRAGDVIQGIRSIVKKGASVRQPVNLNDLVMNVVRVVNPDAVLHSCEIETLLEADLPAIEADPIQLQQVLINLVINAFDAMRDTPPRRRKIVIAAERNGDGTIRASVRDYGVGISEEARERLFESFFTTKAEGLGLGLGIVRSIVESHGGTVAAENVEGGGSRFCFTLPPSAAAL
jgi:signal transduction histidine kinase